MALLKPFIISIVLTVVLDFIWLGFVMNRFNLSQLQEIGRISNGKFDVWMLPAVATYILMATLIVVFVLPRTTDSSLLETFGWGCLMGFCAYGIYDGTNAAILKNYPLAFAAADVAWGTVLFGIITTAVKKLS